MLYLAIDRRRRNRSTTEGGFVAIVEVCGFNDWFLKLLAEYGCSSPEY